MRRKLENTLEINFGNDIKDIDKTDEIQLEKKQSGKLKKYDREDILQETIQYFNGDELAANVWLNKYTLKDSDGNVYEKTPDDMHRRLASEFARIEKKYPNPVSENEVYNLIKKFKYLVPQGGCMTGVGNDFQIASLSNCFVIGQGENADSYGAVMKTDEEQVQLMKRRGGVGHDLSNIRPSGSAVKNSALTSTGVVSFMQRYSNSTREVAQDGRRGALMLSISIKHPDAELFIDSKNDNSKITGANISVKIDDQFMEAVKEDKYYMQQFPIDSGAPLITRKVKARDLWNKIIHNAWKNAEPGVLFWDTILNESIPDCYQDYGFKTISTNPCGEIPLCPYDSCRLLAINLYSYVKDPFTKEVQFDFELFKKHVSIGQRLMDDLVDLEIEKIDTILKKIENDPEPMALKKTELELWKKIREKGLEGRRTGLGITAEGDMLAALGLRYGSEEAISFSTKVHKTLALEAYRSSVIMAQERGSFPLYNAQKEDNNPFIKRIKSEDADLYRSMTKSGRRNIALLTIAPTGTTSLMTQTTSGIEPVFKVHYKRRKKINENDLNVKVDFVDKSGDSWEEYNVFHHQFITWMKTVGFDVNTATNLTEVELAELIKKSPYYNSTANDIDWISKVKMQAAIQKWIDHSISVTVNLPEKVPESLINEIYFTGWELGCKGLTVYREGSRSGVLVSLKNKEDASQAGQPIVKKRPKILEADLLRFNNNNEKWLAVIGLIDGKPYEIFTGKAEDSFLLPDYVKRGWIIKSRMKGGKSVYDLQFEDKEGYKITIGGLSRAFDKEYWNYAKLISGIMRHRMPIQYLVNIVSNLDLNEESLNTWKKGVVRVLSRYIPNGTKPKENLCSQCHQQSLVFEEGCLMCKNCGHTKCS